MHEKNIILKAKELISQNKINEAINFLETNKINYSNSVELYFFLGCLYLEFGKLDSALENFKNALNLDPKNPIIINNIASCYRGKGFHYYSQKLYNKAYSFEKNYLLFQYNLMNNFPRIYKNNDEINFYLEQFFQIIKNLNNKLKRIQDLKDKKNILQELIISPTNFLLPYTGKNVLKHQELYASFYETIIQNYFDFFNKKKIKEEFNKKIKIAFFSNYFNDHTVNKLFRNFILKLDKSKFDIYTFYSGSKFDKYTEEIKSSSKFYQDTNLKNIIEKIFETDLDYLVFYDIGMSQDSQILSSFRLARRQCVLWGHPVSTGFKNIDFFLSSSLMETEDSEKYYSEKLKKLPNLGIYYTSENEEFDDISYRQNSFLVNQSLFKILPIQDEIFKNILDECKQFKISFIQGKNKIETKKLQRRITKELLKSNLSFDKIEFLNRANEDIFLNYIKDCKILLDTFHWSGGHTSLQAFSLNKPVVTLPSKFMRGRHTSAMLNVLELDELIAKDNTDYVRIAKKLAMDEDYYISICNKIKKNKKNLFRDQKVIDEFEKFLEK